jgi:hypothetical protein
MRRHVHAILKKRNRIKNVWVAIRNSAQVKKISVAPGGGGAEHGVISGGWEPGF